MAYFLSDNACPVHPSILQAITDAGQGFHAPYGEDELTREVSESLKDIFETDLVAFPLVSGTAANSLGLASVTPAWGSIYCHEVAHIHQDECGASEMFTNGAKLFPLPGDNAKLDVSTLGDSIVCVDDVHHVKATTISITQATERGTLYTLDEIAAISQIARTNEMTLHMDGARFSNALVSLDVSPKEMTWQRGVDILSFGLTKNGCFCAESVIFFNKGRNTEIFPYLRMKAGHQISKMSMISAQILASLKDDLWLTTARHANAMAQELAKVFEDCSHTHLLYRVEANEVFVDMPPATQALLKQAGVHFYDDHFGNNIARFVCSWATQDRDINLIRKTLERLAA